MNLSTQRRIAAELMNCPEKRVFFSPDKLVEIKAAITRADLRGLISKNVISKKQPQGSSRGRIRINLKQKRKGRRQGMGSREGTHNAKISRKSEWMAKIRAQRNFLKMLRAKAIVPKRTYRMLYSKSKSGMFRSVRHIKLYLEEHKLVQHEKKNTDSAVQKKKAE